MKLHEETCEDIPERPFWDGYSLGLVFFVMPMVAFGVYLIWRYDGPSGGIWQLTY